MPNWVSNKLTVNGPDADEIIQSLLTDDSNEVEGVRFDFNKIVPMPKELNIEEGSTSISCLALYIAAINPEAEYYGKDKVSVDEFENIYSKVCQVLEYSKPERKPTIETIAKLEEKIFKSATKEDGTNYDRESALALGKQAVDNILNHGAMSWYGWSISNWGCKWSASETHVDDNAIWFNTPWSDVRKLMSKLSTQYPKNEFLYEYAEEQPGYYAGFIRLKDGVMLGGDYSQYSKEAYETYFEFYGREDEFEFDEELNTYSYIESEAEM